MSSAVSLKIWEGLKMVYIREWVNSLPSNKILDLTNLKALADGIFNIVEVMTFIFDIVENIVGKGENGGYQHFLPLPQCFQKASLLGSLKVGIVW